MTSKQPKNPHEEIMFCIESTNAIVSEIVVIVKRMAKELDIK